MSNYTPFLDFSEIPSASAKINTSKQGLDDFELFARDFLTIMGFTIDEQPSRGADGGRDMIVSKTITDEFSSVKISWLVSCKHYSAAVNSTDEPDIENRMTRADVEGFMGFYSNVITGNLKDTFEKLSTNRKNVLVFDHRKIENYLIKFMNKIEVRQLCQRYFPKSYHQYCVKNKSISVCLGLSDLLFLEKLHRLNITDATKFRKLLKECSIELKTTPVLWTPSMVARGVQEMQYKNSINMLHNTIMHFEIEELPECISFIASDLYEKSELKNSISLTKFTDTIKINEIKHFVEDLFDQCKKNYNEVIFEIEKELGISFEKKEKMNIDDMTAYIKEKLEPTSSPRTFIIQAMNAMEELLEKESGTKYKQNVEKQLHARSKLNHINKNAKKGNLSPANQSKKIDYNSIVINAVYTMLTDLKLEPIYEKQQGDQFPHISAMLSIFWGVHNGFIPMHHKIKKDPIRYLTQITYLAYAPECTYFSLTGIDPLLAQKLKIPLKQYTLAEKGANLWKNIFNTMELTSDQKELIRRVLQNYE